MCSDSLAGQNTNHVVQLVRFDTHRTVVKIWISFLQHTHRNTHESILTNQKEAVRRGWGRRTDVFTLSPFFTVLVVNFPMAFFAASPRRRWETQRGLVINCPKVCGQLNRHVNYSTPNTTTVCVSCVLQYSVFIILLALWQTVRGEVKVVLQQMEEGEGGDRVLRGGYITLGGRIHLIKY